MRGWSGLTFDDRYGDRAALHLFVMFVVSDRPDILHMPSHCTAEC